DRVEAHFQMATHGAWMVWNWRVTITTREAGIQEFRHSTLQGELASLDEIRRQGPTFVPTVSAAGEMVRAVLELSDGSLTLVQIGEAIVQRFPNHFTDRSKASRFVGKVVHSLCQ